MSTKKRTMRSYRLLNEAVKYLDTKEDKTAYLNALILKDRDSQKDVFKINLEPFNKAARDKIKRILIEEGVHLESIR